MPIDSKIVKPEDQVLHDRSYRLKMDKPLRFLSAKEILVIDEFLANMETDDELCLIVHKGRLRFVTRTKGVDVNHSKES